MRDRRARIGFVGLILAFPPLIAGWAGSGLGWDLAIVELLVAAGLAYAARQRLALRARRSGRPTAPAL